MIFMCCHFDRKDAKVFYKQAEIKHSSASVVFHMIRLLIKQSNRIYSSMVLCTSAEYVKVI